MTNQTLQPISDPALIKANRRVEIVNAIAITETAGESSYGLRVQLAQLDGTEPPGVEVSALEFRQLFTDEERMAITAAAQSSIALRMFLDDAGAASVVHLDHPEVLHGIAACVAAGLITQARADQILAGTPPN